MPQKFKILKAFLLATCGLLPMAALCWSAEPTAQQATDAIETEVALMQAVLHYNAQEYNTALEILKQAGNADKSVRYYRGLCHLKLGQYRAAVAAVSGPQEADGKLSLVSTGLEQWSQGNLKQVEATLVSHLDHYPQDAEARLALGGVLLEEGDKLAAAEQFRLAQMNPDLAPFAANCAACCAADAPPPTVADYSCCESSCNSCCDPCGCQAGGDLGYSNVAQRRWNFTAICGYQYDSNVAISPEFVGLGAPTNMADSGVFVATFGDYRIVQSEDRNVGLIFSTYDNFYFNQNQFDLQDYMGGAYANAVISPNMLAGIRFEYHKSLLDYDNFGEQFRLVPNITFLEGEFGHTTAYYEFNDSTFDFIPLVAEMNRDGQLNAFGITQAIYRQEKQGRIFFGYRYEEENTIGADFDRQTHMVTARVERPLGEQWIADAEVRQFWDDYQNPNSLDFFGQPRNDERTEVRVGLQRYFGKHASLRIDYTYTQTNSNVSNLFGVHFFEYSRHVLNPQFIYDF